MTPYEIPLSPTPQRLTIALAGKDYILLVRYCFHGPCWVLDILLPDETLVVGSIALVTGVDLFGQYAYLGLPGQLYVQSDVDIDVVPGFSDLGTSGHLYFVAVP